MTLPTIDQARSWRGMTLVATDDEPVGRIEAIYGQIEQAAGWALVHTGLFGSSRTFVPLADAAQRGDTVRVPHETSVVREAPRLERGRRAVRGGSPALRPLRDPVRHRRVRQRPAGWRDRGGDRRHHRLPPSSRLEADVPATAGATAGPARRPRRRHLLVRRVDRHRPWRRGQERAGEEGGRRDRRGRSRRGRRRGRRGGRRRRKPPTLGERVGQVGRDTADALAQAAEEIRRTAVAAASGEAQKGTKTSRRAARKANRKANRGRERGRRGRTPGRPGGRRHRDSRRRRQQAGRPQGGKGQRQAAAETGGPPARPRPARPSPSTRGGRRPSGPARRWRR